MAKNYFTHAQVSELIVKASSSDTDSQWYFNDLHNLMNLAVETAIGEPVAQVRVRNGETLGFIGRQDDRQNLPLGAPLYTLKEIPLTKD